MPLSLSFHIFTCLLSAVTDCFTFLMTLYFLNGSAYCCWRNCHKCCLDYANTFFLVIDSDYVQFAVPKLEPVQKLRLVWVIYEVGNVSVMMRLWAYSLNLVYSEGYRLLEPFGSTLGFQFSITLWWGSFTCESSWHHLYLYSMIWFHFRCFFWGKKKFQLLGLAAMKDEPFY